MMKDYVFRKGELLIRGRLYLPHGEADVSGYPLVIFCHGLGSNYRELEHYGPFFAERGIACFLFDFCGGGAESLSDGDFSEMSVQTEIDDLRIVLQEIKKLPTTDTGKIFLMGESQGGYVAAAVAAECAADTAGLILWYPAFNIQEDSRKRDALPTPERYDFFGFRLGERYIRDALRIPIWEKAAEYKKKVLILHGDQDNMVPLAVSEKAVQSYPSAALQVIPGGGHGFEGDDRWRAAQAAADFIFSH